MPRTLLVEFALPNATPAHIDLLDVSGRRMLRREVGSLGQGEHTVDLGVNSRLAAGMYLVRLTQGADMKVMRAVVIH